jgi:hypothetical protein
MDLIENSTWKKVREGFGVVGDVKGFRNHT